MATPRAATSRVIRVVGRRERVVRIVSAGVALVLGVAAAVFGAFIHSAVLVVGEVSLPWGVIGALGVEVGALALAAGPRAASRA